MRKESRLEDILEKFARMTEEEHRRLAEKALKGWAEYERRKKKGSM